MSTSEDLSRSFYSQLGADGLANRTRPEWDEEIIASLIEMLPPGARVLDVGCGYGRIALPLARAGYEVEALDLSENLVVVGRRTARAEGSTSCLKSRSRSPRFARCGVCSGRPVSA